MSVNKVNKTTGDLSLLAGGTLYADSPIGSIIPYGGATAPAGWFICDGTELVRATYPELFTVIGTSFGTPSDNTKFKLPDLREATTKGVGLTGKSNNHYDVDGLSLGEFIDDRLKSHSHFGNYGAVGSGVVGAVPTNGTNYDAAIGTSDTGYSTNEVKAVGVNYIIKAVSIGVPTDFMSAVDEAISRINTSGITESSALLNIGTSANATQHDVNVAIDSKINDIQGTHLYSSLPSDTYTSFPMSLSADITIDGVTIPSYSRGYFCAAIDAMIVLVDANGYTYTCYRNVGTWNKCFTNKPNWVQLGEVADLNFRTAFQNIWDAANNYSLISIASEAGSEGSVFIQKKPGNNLTYGFFSCSTGNYELRHDTDGWMVRKITP